MVARPARRVGTGDEAAQTVVANPRIKGHRPGLAGQGAGGTIGQADSALIAPILVVFDLQTGMHLELARIGQQSEA